MGDVTSIKLKLEDLDLKKSVVCSFCGANLDGKEFTKIVSGNVAGSIVCKSGCIDSCSQCKEVTKFSNSCFSCKRNMFIINRMVNRFGGC